MITLIPQHDQYGNLPYKFPSFFLFSLTVVIFLIQSAHELSSVHCADLFMALEKHVNNTTERSPREKPNVNFPL
jgi:hypothetical protein